jgi:hypothetical protein
MSKHMSFVPTGAANQAFLADEARKAEEARLKAENDRREAAERETARNAAAAENAQRAQKAATERAQRAQEAAALKATDELNVILVHISSGARMLYPNDIVELIAAFYKGVSEVDEVVKRLTRGNDITLLIPNQKLIGNGNGGRIELPLEKFFLADGRFAVVHDKAYWSLFGGWADEQKSLRTAEKIARKESENRSRSDVARRVNRMFDVRDGQKPARHTGKTEMSARKNANWKKNREARAEENRKRSTSKGSGSSKKKED